MRKLILILMALSLPGCAKKTPGYAEYWQNWGNQMLSNWIVAAEQLTADTKSYCHGKLPLDDLQGRIKSLALVWAQINGLPYHAIADLNLNFELYFWPDRRDMTRARLTRRLQGNEPLTTESITEATAAEKGLLAIEWTGFAEGLEQKQRCALLPVIAEQYQRSLHKIADYHQQNPLVVNAWAQNSQSLEGKSIALNLLFQQLAYLSNSLRNSMNMQTGELVPVLAQGWRMNASNDIFAASLNSVIDHLRALSLRTDLSPDTDTQIHEQIASLNKLANKIANPGFDWRQLQQKIIETEHFIEGPVAQELNILLGFSNFDGD